MRESVLINYLKTSSEGCPVAHYQPSCEDVVAMTMMLWPMRAMKKQKSLNVVQSHGLLLTKISLPMSWWCHAREKLGRTSTQEKVRIVPVACMEQTCRRETYLFS